MHQESADACRLRSVPSSQFAQSVVPPIYGQDTYASGVQLWANHPYTNHEIPFTPPWNPCCVFKWFCLSQHTDSHNPHETLEYSERLAWLGAPLHWGEDMSLHLQTDAATSNGWENPMQEASLATSQQPEHVNRCCIRHSVGFIGWTEISRVVRQGSRHISLDSTRCAVSRMLDSAHEMRAPVGLHSFAPSLPSQITQRPPAHLHGKLLAV